MASGSFHLAKHVWAPVPAVVVGVVPVCLDFGNTYVGIGFGVSSGWACSRAPLVC